MGAKLLRADVRTERKTDMARLIASFCNFANASKNIFKNYFSNNPFVHHIKYRPNYDYGPSCKPFLAEVGATEIQRKTNSCYTQRDSCN